MEKENIQIRIRNRTSQRISFLFPKPLSLFFVTSFRREICWDFLFCLFSFFSASKMTRGNLIFSFYFILFFFGTQLRFNKIKPAPYYYSILLQFSYVFQCTKSSYRRYLIRHLSLKKISAEIVSIYCLSCCYLLSFFQ